MLTELKKYDPVHAILCHYYDEASERITDNETARFTTLSYIERIASDLGYYVRPDFRNEVFKGGLPT